MLTLSCSKNPREGSKKSWDGKPRGSGQSHRILLVPRGGWVPLTLGQPLKRLCPHLPHFCFKVPAQKRYFQTEGPQPPPWAPFTTALALGTNQSSPPTSPTIAPDVTAGDGWAQGPAGSGHLVVLSLQSQRFLCQLAWPPHSALPPALFSKGSRWGNTVPSHQLGVPVQYKFHQWSFLSCLSWAVSDREDRRPSRPV